MVSKTLINVRRNCGIGLFKQVDHVSLFRIVLERLERRNMLLGVNVGSCRVLFSSSLLCKKYKENFEFNSSNSLINFHCKFPVSPFLSFYYS